MDKDPASFPSSERGEGGRESLPSVNVPTWLRLLCFVPTCAFQLSALAAVSGSLFSKLCFSKCSVLCSQHKESPAKHRHQTLDQVDRKCRKILSAIKKEKKKKVNWISVIGKQKRRKSEVKMPISSLPSLLQCSCPDRLPERASQEQVETKPS